MRQKRNQYHCNTDNRIILGINTIRKFKDLLVVHVKSKEFKKNESKKISDTAVRMAINALHARKSTEQLWERAVDHPFVRELSNGKLSHDKFRDYIVQDKMLCESIRGFVCGILADCSEAAEFEDAHKLVADRPGYAHEAELFKEMFQAMKINHPQTFLYPTTEAFINFLCKVGSSGTIHEKLVVLYAIESCYMEWSDRAQKRGDVPTDHAYAKWMDIHSSKNTGKMISWIKSKLNNMVLTDHHHKLFQRVLQHEIMFWDSAFYPGRRVLYTRH